MSLPGVTASAIYSGWLSVSRVDNGTFITRTRMNITEGSSNNGPALAASLRIARMSGCAEFPARQSELITEFHPLAARNELKKIELYLSGRLSIRESQPACGNARAMSINRNLAGDTVGST
jgi:hypothetical protein